MTTCTIYYNKCFLLKSGLLVKYNTRKLHIKSFIQKFSTPSLMNLIVSFKETNISEHFVDILHSMILSVQYDSSSNGLKWKTIRGKNISSLRAFQNLLIQQFFAKNFILKFFSKLCICLYFRLNNFISCFGNQFVKILWKNY